ncbi:MAG TPA: hypothetical protein VGP90_11210 [Acidimicrobiia bacterium]|nr:hypothetical protein [Acidimicrobiia bacterium]
MGNYDEMSTARLTWVVLDRLVPNEDVSAAKAALIARDPELQNFVFQGVMSEDEAIAALRARQPRHRDPVPDRSLMRMAAVVLAVMFLGWLALGLLL